MTTSQQSDDSQKTPLPQAQKPAAKPVVAPSVAYTTPLDEAAKFARVTEDGHVFVIIDGAEFPVGQYPDATQEEALGYFVRKYDDALSQLMLLEQRVVAKAPAGELGKAVQALSATVAERHMVGDIPALESRLENVRVAVESLSAEQSKAHDAARAEQLATREAIVEQAEAMAAKRPEQIQWKTASASMNELFEQWKASQRSSVRLPRATEDALWKRFRAARTTFDRHRRAYFSQLDSTNASAKAVKEELIARAEALQSSTDWAATAAEYRKLMDEWKKSRRASRKDDDQLWGRFRAAQDVLPGSCCSKRQDRRRILTESRGEGSTARGSSRIVANQGPSSGQGQAGFHPRPLGISRQGASQRSAAHRIRPASGRRRCEGC